MNQTTPTATQADVLWDSAGKALSLEGALLAPHALNFQVVYNLANKTYWSRFDEALRDSPQNALAMRREAFYARLLQERTAPTINLEWDVEVEDEDDPKQKLVKEALGRIWRAVPDRPGLVTALLEWVWYGRAGVQQQWGDVRGGGTGTVYWEPVNGDGIQYQIDGTPYVLVSARSADRIRSFDPAAVIRGNDRGAYGLRLYRPEYRRRFVIGHHVRSAADYFEGELAGGVHGVGLRHYAYWSGWMRSETFSWITRFMEGTGMMDLVVVNYLSGNDAAKKRAEEIAKQISGKVALTMPRHASESGKYPVVEQVQMNAEGVQVLGDFIKDHYESHLEHLFVGQSMSTGSDTDGSLGGTGKAEFAQDTKGHLLKTDALRLGETLSRDWAEPCKRFNFPWAEFPVRMAPVLEDPDAKDKVDSWLAAAEKGVTVAVSDVRKKLGIREPKPGEPTIGSQPQGQPGQPGDPSNPSTPVDATGPVAGTPEDEVKGLFTAINAATGPARRRPAGGPTDYEQTRGQPTNRGQFGSGGGGGGAPQTKSPTGGGPAARQPQAGPDHPATPLDAPDEGDDLRAVAAAHPAESADPRTAAGVREKVRKVREAVYGWMVRATPAAMQILEALVDTPGDWPKFGYTPTAGGTAGGDAAGMTDPLRAQTGVGTHMALTITSKVLASAVAWGKKRLAARQPQQATPTGERLDRFERTLATILDLVRPIQYGWDESKHPRGQPGNAGEFGAGGGGKKPAKAGGMAGVVAEHAAATGRAKDLLDVALDNYRDAPRAQQIPRELAVHLANAWRDGHRAGYTADELAPAERALRAAGATRVGEPGGAATLDPKTMEAAPGAGQVAAGAPVKVVRPGWTLAEPDGGTLLLARATVRPAGGSGDAGGAVARESTGASAEDD